MSEQMKMDAERAAFEAAYAESQGFEGKAYGLWFKTIGGEYEISQVASAWWGWQKARSQPVGVPDECMVEMAAAAYDRAANAGATHEQAWHEALSVALTAAPTVKAEQVQCRTCNGSRMVDDGEITCSEVGVPYENGPVKCVKDCPDCAAPSLPAAGSAVEGVEVVAWRWKYLIPKEIAGSEWDWSFASHWSTGPKDAEPLMTVAQHERIVAALSAQQSATVADYEDCLADQRRLVRELDALLNGEDGAAPQASLCDIVGQVSSIVRDEGLPLLGAFSARKYAPERVRVPVELLETTVAVLESAEERSTAAELRALLASHGRGEA